MTKFETERRYFHTFAICVGGFCTLWVVLALFIILFIGPLPEVPVRVIMDEKRDASPATLPSELNDQEWILIKKLVEVK